MKNIKNRLLCTLLTLCMLLSLVSGVYAAPSATDIVTTPSGYTAAENVVYKTVGDYVTNWGARGEDCTFLSTYAKSFYTGAYTYERLSELDGGTSAESAPSSDLYDALQELMVENHTYFTHYGGSKANACKNFYQYTDCMLGDPTYVSTIYRGERVGGTWDSGTSYNQEHVWPNSKCIGDDTTDVGDIMHLRAANPSENSARGNKAYGESSGYYNPGVSVRGDCARTVLYMYVRWGNTEYMWGSDGVMESLDILLSWMEEDPVDTWEMGRNDAVQSITGTRNVFVDYPELAFLLFGEEIPADMETPSDSDQITHYTVTAQTNNPDWGTVSVSGKNISASPKTGYLVEGYTVVSGDATVTRKGNVFTVDADEDCTICINFVARESAWILFMENGTATGGLDVYMDDTFTLPESFVQVPGDYTFQGWVDAPLTETTEKPAEVYKPGETLVAEEDVTFYALYSRLDSQGSGSSTAYELVSGELEAGNYLVVTDNGAMTASVTKNRLDVTAVSPVGNAIDNPADTIIWELAFTDDGYVTLYNQATKSYAGGSGSKSQAKLLTTLTDFAKWTPEGDGAYNLLNLGNANKGVNHHLRRNADFGFACYAENFGGPVSLYKQSTGTVYYSTVAVVCEHKNVENVAATEPTCTETGFTAGVFCVDCKSYISGHAVIPAPGHDYVGKVTPPTVTQSGYTTYTCTGCGDQYSGDFTEPLGQQYTVSFAVPQDVEPIESMTCGKNGITLPTAGDVEGYQFAGWVEAQLEDTNETPTIYATTYTAKADTTLYALYTYVVGGSDEMAWKLVTDADDLSAGDSVVLAQNVQGKVAAEISSQYLTQADAQFSEDGTTLTDLPAAALVFTLGGSEGSWTLTCAGQQLGATTVKKLAWDKGTCTWTIDVDENSNATVSSTEATYGRFLYNVNSPRFTTYTSNATSSMLLPQLYKLDGDLGTTYYTTLEGGVVEPTGVTVNGTVIASSEVAGDVTAQLSNDKGVVCTTTAQDGSYIMEAVMPGTYTLTLSKTGHVTRAYTVTVGRQDVTLNGEICLMGDVNGDGQVNIADVSQLYSCVRTNRLPEGYALDCANPNGSEVDIVDVALIYAHVKGSRPLF